MSTKHWINRYINGYFNFRYIKHGYFLFAIQSHNKYIFIPSFSAHSHFPFSPPLLLLSAHLKDLGHLGPEAAVIRMRGEGGKGGRRDGGGVKALHARLPLQLNRVRLWGGDRITAALWLFISWITWITWLWTEGFAISFPPLIPASGGAWRVAPQSYPMNIATAVPGSWSAMDPRRTAYALYMC